MHGSMKLFLVSSALWIPAAAGAQAISLVAGTVNMFRDSRGANDVGASAGERFQFGADVVGGSTGVSLGATYGPTSSTISQFDCGALTVNRNVCSRTATFNANRLQPWTLRFTRGADKLELLGPSLLGTEQAVPFPVSVTLAGSGLTPTVSWVVPNAFAPDGFRINVFDKNRVLTNGNIDVVHSVAIAADASSYALPATFSSGLSLVEGGNYTINLQLIETRGHVAFNNNNAQILRRSNSYFAFTPLTGNNPPAVVLPTVNNGIYNFNIAQVNANSITFIDPVVAVGYDYATGAGNPNFASVLLPNVGDGQFTLAYSDAGGAHAVGLAHGAQYYFGAGGVSSFRVSGIETSAMLDPNNVTAFITGLTFAANGSFTGTMTPLTEFVPGVPEPQSWVLFALGLAGLTQWMRLGGHRRPTGAARSVGGRRPGPRRGESR